MERKPDLLARPERSEGGFRLAGPYRTGTFGREATTLTGRDSQRKGNRLAGRSLRGEGWNGFSFVNNSNLHETLPRDRASQRYEHQKNLAELV